MSKLVCVPPKGQLGDVILQDQMRFIRIIIDILLIFSVFLLPPYISFIIIIGLIFVFNNFVESLLASFVLDLLYGIKSLTIQDNSFLYRVLLDFVCSHRFFFITLFIFIISFNLKKMLKFYPKDKI